MFTFDTLLNLVSALGAASPFAVLAALCFVAFYVWSAKIKIDNVADNHLLHVQDSLDDLVDLSKQQLNAINEVKDNTNYLKGKLDQ